MTIFIECRHIKPGGNKCSSPAIRNTHYCYFHTRLKETAAPKLRDGGQTQSLIQIEGNNIIPSQFQSQDQTIDLAPLEDRSAIQMALSQVIASIASGRLDPKRAGLLLYGLQIASQNAGDTGSISGSGFTVQSMTRTAAGQELGPVKVYCTEPGDCANCSYNKLCDSPRRDDLDDEDEEEQEEDDEGADEGEAMGGEEEGEEEEEEPMFTPAQLKKAVAELIEEAIR